MKWLSIFQVKLYFLNEQNVTVIRSANKSDEKNEMEENPIKRLERKWKFDSNLSTTIKSNKNYVDELSIAILT